MMIWELEVRVFEARVTGDFVSLSLSVVLKGFWQLMRFTDCLLVRHFGELSQLSPWRVAATEEIQQRQHHGERGMPITHPSQVRVLLETLIYFFGTQVLSRTLMTTRPASCAHWVGQPSGVQVSWQGDAGRFGRAGTVSTVSQVCASGFFDAPAALR